MQIQSLRQSNAIMSKAIGMQFKIQIINVHVQ